MPTHDRQEQFAREGSDDPITPIDFSPPPPERKGPGLSFTWLHGLILGFIVVAGLAAWFVLTARSVYVQVEPVTAEVEINGGFSVQLGRRHLIRPGEYQVSLSNDGYHDMETELVVSDEPAQIHPYSLTRLPGIITIASTVADGDVAGDILTDEEIGQSLSGARVQIDNVDVGETPLTGIEVEAGERELVVFKDRYQPYRQNIVVEGRSVEQEFEVGLAPAWAEVSFVTEPPGADILIDGKNRGTTPSQVEVLEGNREVILKLAGHKAWQDRLRVEAGDDLNLEPVPLERADGLVFIRSTPGQANVTVNGEFQGQTPLELALPPDAEHEISLFRSGYNPARRSVALGPEEAQDLSITLEPITAQVSVVADPPDAELYIDGEYKGDASQTIELLAASQQVEIRKDGYVPYTSTFVSRPGLEQEIRVNLKTLEEARIENIQPEITTVAGQSLKLLYPYEFTMGASRREPGRRANETLREIVMERPFYLARHEVTNAQYRLYDSEHSSGTLQGQSMDLESQPVTQVSWQDAALYCNWLSEQESLPPFYQVEDGEVTGFNPYSIGYRLPTEAEWEWAARAEGDSALRFSWGETLPPPENAGNFADISTSRFLGDILRDYDDGYVGTAPVGSFEPNSKGLYDLSGNVAEWVHDFYGAVGSLSREKETDPLGPETGRYHVIKGSSWAHGSLTELRLSYRDFDEAARDDVGFRIARYLEN